MNWNKLRSPTGATLTNLIFRYFCELGKSFKCSLRPTFKVPILNLSMNSKICPNLSFTVENKGNLHKIRPVLFQTKYNE